MKDEKMKKIIQITLLCFLIGTFQLTAGYLDIENSNEQLSNETFEEINILNSNVYIDNSVINRTYVENSVLEVENSVVNTFFMLGSSELTVRNSSIYSIATYPNSSSDIYVYENSVNNLMIADNFSGCFYFNAKLTKISDYLIEGIWNGSNNMFTIDYRSNSSIINSVQEVPEVSSSIIFCLGIFLVNGNTRKNIQKVRKIKK